MDNLVKIIDSLAWPLIVLFLFLIFRAELTKIFTRLSNLKYKDFEAKFGNQLNDVEKKIETLKISVSEDLKVQENLEVGTEAETDYDRLIRLSEISPRAAITEAWIAVETAAKFAVKEANLEVKHSSNIMNVVKILIDKRLFNKNAVNVFNELRSLRNEAAHAPDFLLSQNDAQKYIDLSLRLAQDIYSAGRDVN